MGVDIRLLGPPQIVVDGEPRRLKGRKSWGLLATVLLEPNTTRRNLVDRLFADADDPMATLRWHLLQVRRAVEPAGIVETAGHLQLTGDGIRVDAVEVLESLVPMEQVRAVCRGELLEGMSFHETPGFELWISLQRNRVAAAAGDILRWAASMLARANPPEALALVERALLTDPFNDAMHELAVDIHLQQSRAAAEGYVERVSRLYEQELGAGLPASVLRPLTSIASSPGAPRLDAQTSAQTLMKVVEARLGANDYERAMEVARRRRPRPRSRGTAGSRPGRSSRSAGP